MKVLDAKVNWFESYNNLPRFQILVNSTPDLEYKYMWGNGGSRHTAVWYAERDGYANFYAHCFNWKIKMGNRWSFNRRKKCPKCHKQIEKNYIYTAFIETGHQQFSLLCPQNDHTFEVKVLPDRGFAGRVFEVKHVSGHTATLAGPWSSRASEMRRLGLGDVYPASYTRTPEVMERDYTFYSGAFTRDILVEAAKKAGVNLVRIREGQDRRNMQLGSDQAAILSDDIGGLYPSMWPGAVVKPKRLRHPENEGDEWVLSKTEEGQMETLWDVGRISIEKAFEKGRRHD